QENRIVHPRTLKGCHLNLAGRNLGKATQESPIHSRQTTRAWLSCHHERLAEQINGRPEGLAELGSLARSLIPYGTPTPTRNDDERRGGAASVHQPLLPNSSAPVPGAFH